MSLSLVLASNSSSVMWGIMSIGKSLMNLYKSLTISSGVMDKGFCNSCNQSVLWIFSKGNKYFLDASFLKAVLSIGGTSIVEEELFS